MLSIPRSVSSVRICAWRVAFVAVRDPVEMGRPVDHVEPQVRRVAQVALHRAVDLAELLLDRRVARRIHAGEPPQADEALEQRQRIGGREKRHRGQWASGHGDQELEQRVRAPADTGKRRAPDAVAQRHQRRQHRRQAVRPELRRAIEQPGRERRVLQHEHPGARGVPAPACAPPPAGTATSVSAAAPESQVVAGSTAPRTSAAARAVPIRARHRSASRPVCSSALRSWVATIGS